LNGEELIANLLISGMGVDIRAFYTTIGTDSYIEYIGFTNALNAPTSAKCWFITKLQYDGSGNFVRARKLSTQEILDNRASLFP
jgi:hypothetical protein